MYLLGGPNMGRGGPGGQGGMPGTGTTQFENMKRIISLLQNANLEGSFLNG